MACEAKNKQWTLCGSLSLSFWQTPIECKPSIRSGVRTGCFKWSFQGDRRIVIRCQSILAGLYPDPICFYHPLLSSTSISALNALCATSNRICSTDFVRNSSLRYQRPVNDNQCLASQGLLRQSNVRVELMCLHHGLLLSTLVTDDQSDWTHLFWCEKKRSTRVLTILSWYFLDSFLVIS